jgi:hypothetical protein
MFDKLLISKIPGLTQDEINHFREAIAGEVNTQLSISQVLAPAYDPSKDEADVKHIEDDTSSKNIPNTDTSQTIQVSQ